MFFLGFESEGCSPGAVSATSCLTVTSHPAGQRPQAVHGRLWEHHEHAQREGEESHSL